MKSEELNIAGIDYGSKLAGTTVIAHLKDGIVSFSSSTKKKDADQFLLAWIDHHKPEALFLDAPLSLPGVFRSLEGYDDYFYRAADRAVGGMSPMFLGGLTARAMRLSQLIQAKGVEVVEIYPSKLAEIYELKAINYKKKKIDLLPNIAHFRTIHPHLNFKQDDILSWHHFDALLALASGIRFSKQEHMVFGKEEEGTITV